MNWKVIRNALGCGAAALAVLCGAATAHALDRVRLLAGTNVNGQVVEMTPVEVKVEVSGAPKNYAVNTIEYIQFDDEPKDLTNARNAYREGKYSIALNLLKKIKVDDLKRREVKQDVEFYRAIVRAKMALAGNGSLIDAGKLLIAFESANKGSFHYLEAAETIGDLLVAAGKVEQAEPFYAKLAAAPWPEYRLKAGVAQGRALESQKKYDAAIAKYQEVLAANGAGKDAEKQKQAAALGKATSLAGSGKLDEAVKEIEAIIVKADPENTELHARAYVALGNCYLAANKPKDALIAFLEVDTLYPGYPEQHAEALANLASLWKTAADKADRANQARAVLTERYPNSRWAAK